jgi:hypothetical protein
MSLTPNASPYVVTIEQVGANVVMTGSGEFDLTGLTAIGGGPSAVGPGINPSNGWNPSGSLVYLGTAGEIAEYSGTVTYSTNSIGSSGNTFANDASGPLVELRTGNFALFLPVGGSYFLPNILVLLPSSTDIFYNTTIAGLGITPGTYTWTWGDWRGSKLYHSDPNGDALDKYARRQLVPHSKLEPQSPHS